MAEIVKHSFRSLFMNVMSMYLEKSRLADMSDCMCLTLFTELLYTNLLSPNFKILVVYVYGLSTNDTMCS